MGKYLRYKEFFFVHEIETWSDIYEPRIVNIQFYWWFYPHYQVWYYDKE